MWPLLLFSLAGLFLLGDSAANIKIETKIGTKCPNWNSDLDILVPTLFTMVEVNRTSKRINRILGMKLDNGQSAFEFNTEMQFELDPKFGGIDEKNFRYEILVNVIARGNDAMDGMDNPIYYGFGMTADKTTGIFDGAPAKNFKNYPFRLQEFKLTYEDGKTKTVLLEANNKNPQCDDHENEAWIANHGIYRLEKKGDNILFKNMYYYPFPGIIFT